MKEDEITCWMLRGTSDTAADLDECTFVEYELFRPDDGDLDIWNCDAAF